MTYVLSIETDAGTYVHGYNLGTDLPIARQLAEEIYQKRVPRIGTRIVTVAIVSDDVFEVYDGSWFPCGEDESSESD